MRKLGIRLALTGLVLASVTLTALLIHLTWVAASQRNVKDLAAQLNRQIMDEIERNFFAANYNVAWSSDEALRLLLSSPRQAAGPPGQHRAVLAGMLSSQPLLSSLAILRRDGAMLIVRRGSDGQLQGIEIEKDPISGDRRQNSYKFDETGAVGESERVGQPQWDDPTAADWYRQALSHGDLIASEIESLPGATGPTLCFAMPFGGVGGPIGVIAATIDFDKIAKFLDGLPVGKSGTVIMLDSDGRVVAAAEANGGARDAVRPKLTEIADHDPRLAALAAQLASGEPRLGDLPEPVQYRVSRRDDSYFIGFSALSFLGWTVATVIPASDFLAGIDRNATLVLAVLAILTAVMALLATLLANRLIAEPLVRITGQLKFIESFNLAAIHKLEAPLIELDNLSTALVQMSHGLASFEKFMPADLVRTLVSSGIEARPGVRQANLTVLFTDIAGFTGMSETLGEAILPLLGDFLSAASAAILAQNGTIDKFIGDAVMAFWGAPAANDRQALAACAAALDLQRRLEEGHQRRAELGLPPLRARIGINTGTVLVGNVGTDDRLSYTAIGDAVNIASRLEGLNKEFATQILIGEATKEAAGDAILVRRVDRVAVKGREQELTIYELLGLRDQGDIT